MVAAKTTDDLLEEVREEAMLPDAEGRIDSAGILRIASKRLSTSIADLLISLRQERWVTTHSDVAIMSGTARYRIPARALAAGVADVLIVDSGGEVYSAHELAAEERWRYTAGRRGPWNSPFAYAWEGDYVVLLPTPDASGYSLRIRYPRQPARLVAVDACVEVKSVGSGVWDPNGAIPGTWGASETLDYVRGQPGGDVLAIDVVTTYSSPLFTPSTMPAELGPGDYACQAGETCIPPIPESVWAVLVSETALGVLRAIGDPGGTADVERNLAAATVHARNVLAPRNRGERKMVVAHSSALRGGRFAGWRR